MSARKPRMGSRYINESGQLVHLSSYAYVPMRIRGSGELWTAIRIALNPQRCEDYNICEWCAESWTWDWEVAFDRTVGGRRLRDRAMAIGADLDAWRRWGNGTATDDDAARMRNQSGRCGTDQT